MREENDKKQAKTSWPLIEWTEIVDENDVKKLIVKEGIIIEKTSPEIWAK